MSQRRDLRQVGDRLEQVVGEVNEIPDPVARARAQEAVRLLVDLYGGALERILTVLTDDGDGTPVDRLAGDELIASLLIAHDLHPRSMLERVEGALERVRPYLGSHGGDVELLGVSDEGVVRLRLVGSCDGCPSSSITLKLAVEGAIETDAPEVTAIEVDNATSSNGHGGERLIPLESLAQRPSDGPAVSAAVPAPADAGPSWQPLPTGNGQAVQRAEIGGVAIVICRPDDGGVFVFQDRCALCTSSLDGAVLVGGTLACPACGAAYDVAKAGRATEGEAHLDPLPVLTRDGALEVAVPAAVGP